MEEHYEDGFYCDPYDDWEDDYDEDPCSKCGPWCEQWGGDNLCMLEIEEQARQGEEFEKRHVSISKCPVCGKVLKQFSIPADELWIWPGEWPNDPNRYYTPMIALFEVYGAIYTPKGVFHSDGNIHHIWTGDKDNQKLIRLR